MAGDLGTVSDEDFHTDVASDLAATPFEALHEAEARFIEAHANLPARLIAIVEPAEGGWKVHLRLTFS